MQPLCTLVYIVCNPAPRDSPFELPLGLHSKLPSPIHPLRVRVCWFLVFGLGSPQYCSTHDRKACIRDVGPKNIRTLLSNVIGASIKKLDGNILESGMGEIPCFSLYFCQIESVQSEELTFSSTPSLRNKDWVSSAVVAFWTNATQSGHSIPGAGLSL